MPKLEAGVPLGNVDAMLRREQELFVQRHARSREFAERAEAHWAHGVPMHWMLDWGTPFPIYVASAKGARLTDVDGHAYDDFCFGDTGSMFGHSPEPIAQAIAEQAARGLTYMLPTEDVRGGRRAAGEDVRPAFLAGGDHGDRREPIRDPLVPGDHQAL